MLCLLLLLFLLLLWRVTHVWLIVETSDPIIAYNLEVTEVQFDLSIRVHSQCHLVHTHTISMCPIF